MTLHRQYHGALTFFENTYIYIYATQGQYTLTASHVTWKFKKSEAVVTAAFGSTAVLETFGVLGYDVSGSVAWVGGMVGVSMPVLLMPGRACC